MPAVKHAHCMKKLRILLADGHRIVRAGLKLLINTQPDMAVIGEATEGKEAYAKARSLHPDVAVLELDLPRWNGLRAAEQIKLRGPAVAVLVLTAHEKAPGLAELLDAKASGCVLKRSAPAELFAAIRAVAKGAVHFDPALLDPAPRRAIGTLSATGRPRRRALSRRERRVLGLAAWGYSNKEIAAQLGVSAKTVETYKMRFGVKLGLHGRVDLVRYAVGHGLLSQP